MGLVGTLSVVESGELSVLVGVEDIRLALLESLLQGLDTEAGVQGVG